MNRLRFILEFISVIVSLPLAMAFLIIRIAWDLADIVYTRDLRKDLRGG